ncbi:MAG: stage II sporulation protein M [Candidatus Pacebacteria bacterium]|nr:stage II sporulation protein M [Candidatus Paceibacterota bacterium]
MTKDQIKNYFFSLKNYVIFTTLIFVFSIIFGYFLFNTVSNYLPKEESDKFIEEIEGQIKSLVEPFLVLENFSRPLQVFLIWLKNIQSLGIITIFSFIFGISSFYGILINGILLGFLSFIFLIFLKKPFSDFLLLILPHGIIEIPVMILSAAIGIKIGKISIDKIINYFQSLFGNHKSFEINKKSVKMELNLGCEFFLQVLVPLLFLAAILEIYVTGQLALY